MSTVLRDLLIGAAATVIGTLAAQWLTNNSRTVRRAVGGL